MVFLQVFLNIFTKIQLCSLYIVCHVRNLQLNTQQLACDTQHGTHKMQRTTCNTQHAMQNLQHIALTHDKWNLAIM